MNDLKFVTYEGEPKPEDFTSLSNGLLAHHAVKVIRESRKSFVSS